MKQRKARYEEICNFDVVETFCSIHIVCLSVCLSVRPHVALGMKRNKACSSEIQGGGREGEKALNCGTIKYIHTYICICTRDAGNRYLFMNLEMNKANAIIC